METQSKMIYTYTYLYLHLSIYLCLYQCSRHRAYALKIGNLHHIPSSKASGTIEEGGAERLKEPEAIDDNDKATF